MKKLEITERDWKAGRHVLSHAEILACELRFIDESKAPQRYIGRRDKRRPVDGPVTPDRSNWYRSDVRSILEKVWSAAHA